MRVSSPAWRRKRTWPRMNHHAIAATPAIQMRGSMPAPSAVTAGAAWTASACTGRSACTDNTDGAALPGSRLAVTTMGTISQAW